MPETPVLNRMLSRADPVPAPAPMDVSGDYSAAMLGYFADFGRFPDAAVLRADPVHLRADKSCVRLFGTAGLSLNAEEAAALIRAFNELYLHDGMRLEMATPERWYLHLAQQPALEFTPTAGIHGQDIDPHLPRGDEAKQWHAMLNEWQMLFFGHAVNQARAQNRQPMINGIWVWGEAMPAALPPEDTEQVWSDDPVTRGVAAVAGLPGHDVPPSASDWLAQVEDGYHWLAIPDLQQAGMIEDPEEWRRHIERLEKVWFAPLYEAVIGKSLSSVTVSGGTDMAWQFRASHRLRFWRRGSAVAGMLRHG